MCSKNLQVVDLSWRTINSWSTGREARFCNDDAGDAQMILASKVDDGRRGESWCLPTWEDLSEYQVRNTPATICPIWKNNFAIWKNTNMSEYQVRNTPYATSNTWHLISYQNISFRFQRMLCNAMDVSSRKYLLEFRIFSSVDCYSCII